MTDDIHYEAKPGGGLRIETGGITVDIPRDAIERAEREHGLGFNLALTPEEHEALGKPFDEFESPVKESLDVWLQIQPKSMSDGDTDA